MLNRKNCVPLRPFMRRLILFLSFLGALCAPLRLLADTTQAADELDSTLRVSLLTCSPGSATGSFSKRPENRCGQANGATPYSLGRQVRGADSRQNHSLLISVSTDNIFWRRV